MHRNKTKNAYTVLPCESLLLKENSEKSTVGGGTSSKPIVGKVGKWGATSFTSIRTAYRVGLQTSPASVPHPQQPLNQQSHDSANEEAAVEASTVAPRPRKFFKSRASAAPPPQLQQSFAVVEEAAPEKKNKREKKEKVKKQPKKPEIPPERPATRVSARNRNKCINYNEDDSASVSSAILATTAATVAATNVEPIVPVHEPEIVRPPSPLPLPPVVSPAPAVSPPVSAPAAVPEEDHPKIVLRISKKTLKVVDPTEEEPRAPTPPPVEPVPTSPERPKLIKKLCIRKQAEDFSIAQRDPTPPPPSPPKPDPEPEQPEPQPEPEPVVTPTRPGRKPRKRKPVEVREATPPPEPAPVVAAPEPTRPRRGRAALASPPVAAPVPAPEPQTRPVKKRGRAVIEEVTPTKRDPTPPPVVASEPEPPKRRRGRAAAQPKIIEEENVEPPQPPPQKTPKATPEKRQTTPNKKQAIPPQAATKDVTPDRVEGTRRTRNRTKTMQDNKNEVQKSLPEVAETLPPVATRAVARSPIPVVQSPNSAAAAAEEKPPSVKLVISKKKGSIFKSRALVNDAGNKRHVYKHKFGQDHDDEDESVKEKTPDKDSEKKSTIETKIDTDFEFDEPPKKVDEAKSVTKEAEKRPAPYTFVRNVKKAHQMQEIGEFQELDDDVEYILSALQPDNPIATRCLSTLQLASKCMTPAFRMHVRAHGIVTKFFKALQDAPNDQNLGLCTATVLFVLSQDTLNMDLDRDSLLLMLNLLDVSKEKKVSGSSQTQLQKNKKKVKELCGEIKGLGKAAHLNLENITIGTLAMETLLSLTSKRAGEWFKEELRTLGGLDHIVRTVCDCCQQISDYVAQWSEDLLDKLRKIERCLRVLENVTNQNQENQSHVLNYSGGVAVDTLVKFYKLCDTEISLYPTNDSTPKDSPGVIIREALAPTLKVLINLTHPFNTEAEGSVRVGRISGVFDTSLHLLLQSPNYVPEQCVFEISILVLLLLINLTTFTEANRNAIMQAHAPTDFGSQFARVPAIKALVKYFYKCEELATLAEKNTDAILDTPAERDSKSKSQEEVDETVTKLLQKAGYHMEHTMLASYVSILIGHLIVDNELYKTIITKHLHNGSFAAFAKILEKYYNFMSLTASSEATVVEHVKSTKKMLDYLKELD